MSSSRSIATDLDVRKHEWPLRIVLSPYQSCRRVSVNIAVCTLALPIVLFFVGLFVEDNIYLPGPAIGLIEDWNILCMFITFPIALHLLNLVCSRFMLLLSRLPDLIALPAAKTRQPSAEDIYKSMSHITRHEGGWKLVRLMFLAAGFAFVIFNAYNRFYRSSEVYFEGFWTSSEFPIAFWVTNIYTSLVWGYLSPIIVFTLITIIAGIYQLNKKLIESDGFNLRLLSPDNVGGLKLLPDLALAMCYVTIPFQTQVLVYYLWIPKIIEARISNGYPL